MKTPSRPVHSVALAALLTFGLFTASAQEQAPPPRHRLVLGFALGPAYSALRVDNTRQRQLGTGLNWQIGYRLRPLLAVLLNGAATVYDNPVIVRPRKRDLGGLFPSVQYWLNDRCWVLGGAGLGTDAPVFYDLKPANRNETTYYPGLGLVASSGYTLYQRSSWAAEVQLRATYDNVRTVEGRVKGFSTAVLVGIRLR